MKGTLYLVNRVHPLPEELAAEDLTSVRSSQAEVRSHQRAKVMLDQFLAAVDGADTIIPVSGYRPQTEQQAIRDDTPAEHGSAFTEAYVAHPRCSEHRTELVIDLGEDGPKVDFLCPAFPNFGSCGALRRRAADFSFIPRYPKGKEAVTGIRYESWHFRYVGWPHAKLMEERHPVLEEYLEWLHDLPLERELLRLWGLGRLSELYYLPAWAADTLALPADIPCQRCDTNKDGVVLTLWRGAG